MTDNIVYEHIYDKNILSLYNYIDCCKEDTQTLSENILPHKYSIIEERVDMTHIECYSIDPPGCEDADDAFSVYHDKQKLYLAIHIADPTEYINIESQLWETIKSRIITRYPSNRKPFHMMPIEIMEKSSLMDNNYGNEKNAISIVIEIDEETYKPQGEIKLLFTKIKVKKENALAYNDACNRIDEIHAIKTSLKISEVLIKERTSRTNGTILNDVSISAVTYENNIPSLVNVSQNEKRMKQMIAEFAIIANSFIGNYLKTHLNETGIFRTCDANSIINNKEMINMTGDELLEEIITQGIQADYASKVASHDLVGSEEYTHFTSPIRRVSDCICHYLLKYIFLSQHNKTLISPFTLDSLKSLSDNCVNLSKKMKKVQYKDTKFRLIQTMNNMLKVTKKITIMYYVTSYMNGFLNIIINKIDNYNSYLSYSLRIPNYNNAYEAKKKHTIDITIVNCPKKFDIGSIPELDAQFIY